MHVKAMSPKVVAAKSTKPEVLGVKAREAFPLDASNLPRRCRSSRACDSTSSEEGISPDVSNCWSSCRIESWHASTSTVFAIVSLEKARTYKSHLLKCCRETSGWG